MRARRVVSRRMIEIHDVTLLGHDVSYELCMSGVFWCCGFAADSRTGAQFDGTLQNSPSAIPASGFVWGTRGAVRPMRCDVAEKTVDRGGWTRVVSSSISIPTNRGARQVQLQ